MSLESGDVLVWGGPNRMLRHCVGKVYSNTAPTYLPADLRNARLCFTLRDTPTMAGHEWEFQ